MKKRNKDRTVSKGWAGRWSDGCIGWFMPRHCGGYGESPVEDKNAAGKKCYRVRVTVEVLRNKHGEEIVRRFRAPAKTGNEGGESK